MQPPPQAGRSAASVHQEQLYPMWTSGRIALSQEMLIGGANVRVVKHAEMQRGSSSVAGFKGHARALGYLINLSLCSSVFKLENHWPRSWLLHIVFSSGKEKEI